MPAVLVGWEFRVGIVAVLGGMFGLPAALGGVFGVAVVLGGVFGVAAVLGRRLGAAAVVFECPATQDIAMCGLLKC